MSSAKVFFIEGSDYSGKTTLIRKINKQLTQKGFKVLVMKEPVSPLRELLLSSDIDFGFTGRRLLFAGSHALVMEEIYKAREDYDFIIVDRTSLITDFVYMQMEINEDTCFGASELCGHIDNSIVLADSTFYDGFFRKNSSLILLNLDKCDFEQRVASRQVDVSDKYDQKPMKYKEEVWKSYNGLINRIQLGNLSLNEFFDKVYIVPAVDGDQFIPQILKEDQDVKEN